MKNIIIDARVKGFRRCRAALLLQSNLTALEQPHSRRATLVRKNGAAAWSERERT